MCICGFNVSEEMKRVWAAQVKVLEKVIDICLKRNDYMKLIECLKEELPS